MSILGDLDTQAIEDIVYYLELEYDHDYHEDMADESRRDFRDYTKALKWAIEVLNNLKHQVEYEQKRLAFHEAYERKVREAQQQLTQLKKLEG